MATSKKTTVKLSTILLVVLVIGAIAYYFKDEIKKMLNKGKVESLDAPFPDATPSKGNTPKGSGSSTPKGSGSSTPKDKNKPLPSFMDLDTKKVLKKGSKGMEVIALQYLINFEAKDRNMAYINITTDGDYGNQTQTALDQIGWVAPITLGGLPILKIYPKK